MQLFRLFHNVAFYQKLNIMEQDNKNFNSGLPIICQLLIMVPDHLFKQAVEETESDRYYKKMKSKDHFISLFYAVLTRNGSLREVCKNIILLGKKLMYAGLKQIPCRSTLSDANNNRDHSFFSNLYGKLYSYYRTELKTFHLPIGGEVSAGDVDIFDSTTITLFKDIVKGAGRNPLNGNKKGGIKAFTKTNLSEGVPDFVCLKPASTNENIFLKTLTLLKGAIAIFDKGFNKYFYFDLWTAKGIFFVTRLKTNAKYEIETEFDCSEYPDVRQDQLISIVYRENKITRTVKLRLITYRDPISGETLEFLTNMMGHTALTISLLYKNRWTIELLFKQIKQNFELKYFLSDSENGIKSQIWVALILNLIFTVIHRRIKQAEDFSTLVQVAAKNLCSYVDLKLFLTQTEEYCKSWFKKEVGKMQLDIWANGMGDVFNNIRKPTKLEPNPI